MKKTRTLVGAQTLPDGAISIPLNKGARAVIDAADFSWVSLAAWNVRTSKSGNRYAQRTVWSEDRKSSSLLSLHRAILQAPIGQAVDHIDGNGLNNCRSNLRLCNRAQNAANVRPRVNARSRFKGVTFYNVTSRWRARIAYQGKTKYLGYYLTEEAAALAYDKAAVSLHGEFARPNFPAANAELLKV